MKQVLTILCAVTIFDLTITLANGVGIALTLLGGALYAAVELREKDTKTHSTRRVALDPSSRAVSSGGSNGVGRQGHLEVRGTPHLTADSRKSPRSGEARTTGTTTPRSMTAGGVTVVIVAASVDSVRSLA